MFHSVYHRITGCKKDRSGRTCLFRWGSKMLGPGRRQADGWLNNSIFLRITWWKNFETRSSAVAVRPRDASCDRITEYFTKSLEATQGHSKWHSSERRKPLLVFRCNLVRFLRYSALNNGVNLITWLGIVQGHWKWHHSNAWLRFPICLP